MEFNLSSPASPSSLSDYIGSESCIDLHDDDDDVQVQSSVHHSYKHCKYDNVREFPPPIPLLARTENLSPHMPWILRRDYTSDGRLVLTEEKVRYHEYFRAYRGDGRLRLQLIRICDDEESEEPESNEEEDEVFDDETDTVLEESIITKIKSETGTPFSLNMNMATSPSCRFGLPVPAARIVST